MGTLRTANHFRLMGIDGKAVRFDEEFYERELLASLGLKVEESKPITWFSSKENAAALTAILREALRMRLDGGGEADAEP